MRSRSVSRSVLRYGNSGVLWLVNARNLASALREETIAQARPAWCVPTTVGVLARIVNGEGLCRVVVTPTWSPRRVAPRGVRRPSCDSFIRTLFPGVRRGPSAPACTDQRPPLGVLHRPSDAVTAERTILGVLHRTGDAVDVEVTILGVPQRPDDERRTRTRASVRVRREKSAVEASSALGCEMIAPQVSGRWPPRRRAP